MTQIIIFAVGLFVGLLLAILILATNLYKFYQEKYTLLNRIKRLEDVNSENKF
jgi:uncharacterized membrane protein